MGIIGPETDEESYEQSHQLLQDDQSVKFDQDGTIVTQSIDKESNKESNSGRGEIKKRLTQNTSKNLLGQMSQVTLPTVPTHGHSMVTLQPSSLS